MGNSTSKFFHEESNSLASSDSEELDQEPTVKESSTAAVNYLAVLRKTFHNDSNSLAASDSEALDLPTAKESTNKFFHDDDSNSLASSDSEELDQCDLPTVKNSASRKFFHDDANSLASSEDLQSP